MAVLTERRIEPLLEPAPHEADHLRSLVSAMLSGGDQEELALLEAVSLCRWKAQMGRQLLSMIDRYEQLGQMPTSQHRKIRDRIEQSLNNRTAAQASSAPRVQHHDPVHASTVTTEVPVLGATSYDLPRQEAGPTVTAPLPVKTAKPAASSRDADQIPASTSDAQAPAGTQGAATAVGQPWTPPGATVEMPRAPTPARASLRTPPLDSSARAQREPSTPSSAATPTPRPLPAAPPTERSAEDPLGSIEQIIAGLARAETPTRVIGPGTVLRGRYELQGLLGFGGMASVFKAIDRYRARLGLQNCGVALKIIASRPPNPAHVAALGREFHNAQQLSHPNIINVYEIDHEGDASFYTMELLEGEQLNQLHERLGGLLPARYALAILRDIGEAIAHAHSRGVVHGDLKPQNIFVTYGGQVRVLDFGGLSPTPAVRNLGPRAGLAARAIFAPEDRPSSLDPSAVAEPVVHRATAHRLSGRDSRLCQLRATGRPARRPAR